MGKKLASILICFILMLPGAAFAEEKNENVLKLEELTVQVLPEFAKHPEDKETAQPPLLIGYQGSLINSSDKAQKGKIEIPLPVEEKNFRIGFVADYASDLSQMFEIEYELDKEKGTIAWETSREIEPNEQYKFIIEFYTDAIKKDKESKSLNYTFTSFTDITMFNLAVVEPMESSKVKLDPVPTETPHGDTYGLTKHIYQVKSMKPGQEFNVKLAYDRNETKTTNELMESKVGKQSPAKAIKTDKVPLGLTIAGISAASILAAGLLLLFFKRRQKALPEAVIEADVSGFKKAQLRKMLIDGSITEDEYNELQKKLKS
ncbi:hypothetical protein AM500_07440 [Bacillus sp. FJAT-18017]|uniref:hypothetical protein n=1 Tax=Bacillus sp. FJAT-18017 TaxID=1705566 RepID=UPI0006AD9984|nr:hypothetical protein [Bacillus sp. FJAT-18017]ALC89614.1 hypothetical protein AM500_07440 [Bacillus sp. FJAT-18017]